MPLSSSFVDSAEFERLLERIASDDPSLREVDLEQRCIGDAGVRRLAVAFRGNTHVTSLNLVYNNIGDEGARELAVVFDINSPCTHICLADNNISDNGAKTFAEALQHNSTLIALGLERNNISDDGARSFAEVLCNNCTIAALGLSENNVGDDGGRALANVLSQNSTLKDLSLDENNIGDEGGRAFFEVLHGNSSIIVNLEDNEIDEELEATIEKLVDINDDAPNTEEAHRLKVELRVGWMLDSEGRLEYGAAVTLALAELGNFPEVDRRRGLFERLLGSTERGVDVAASVDTAGGRVLYWYAAECGAAPVVLMNLLRAHPSLCACRDIKHKLFPFMLLATMHEAGVGDVMEALLENPSLVKSGIGMADEHRARKRVRVDGSGK